MHSEYLRWMCRELAAGELTIGRKKVTLGASPAELYVLGARGSDHALARLQDHAARR